MLFPNGVVGLPQLSEAMLADRAMSLFRDENHAAINAIFTDKVTLLASLATADIPVFPTYVAGSP